MTQLLLRTAQPGGWRFLCPKDISGGPRVLASKQAEFSLVPGQTRRFLLPNLAHSSPEQCSLGTRVTESPAQVLVLFLSPTEGWKVGRPCRSFPLGTLFPGPLSPACQLCPVLPLTFAEHLPKTLPLPKLHQSANTHKASRIPLHAGEYLEGSPTHS